MFNTLIPRTHETLEEPQTDDGKYLVFNGYQMAFPPLRSYFREACRPEFTGQPDGDPSSAPVMAYNDPLDGSAGYRKNYYMWAWPAPGADPVASLPYNSVYWSDYATMTSLQAIAAGTFNYTEAHINGGKDGLHIVNDGSGLTAGAANQAPILTANQQAQQFATFLPNWASMEFFLAGNILMDRAIDSQAYPLLVNGRTAQLITTFSDIDSRVGWTWSGTAWVQQSRYFQQCTPIQQNMGPGYFELRVRLEDLSRNQNGPVYVNRSLGTYDIPAQPAFTPPSPLPANYVWPQNDGAGLTLVQTFSPANMTTIEFQVLPQDGTVSGDSNGKAMKVNLDFVRFRPTSGGTGITYTDDVYLINSVVGEPTFYQTTTPVKLGEGYQLELTATPTGLYKYVAANNRFSSKTNYPFSLYARFTIEDPSLLSAGHQGYLVSLGGPSSDNSFSACLLIDSGYVAVQIVQPNYDAWEGPTVNSDGTLNSLDTAIQDPVPSGGKYGTNWKLTTGVEYQVVAVFSSPTADANGRIGVTAYILDSGLAYKVAQINLNDNAGAISRYAAGMNGECIQIAFGAANYRGSIANPFLGSLVEARLYNQALTTADMLAMTAGAAATDGAKAKLDQYWTFPAASASWGGFISPSTPIGATFPAGNGNALDVATVGYAVPQISLEVRDENSTTYYNKLEVLQPAPPGTQTQIAIPLDTTTTPGGSYLDHTNLTAIYISAQNAPSNAISINLLRFIQLNKVIVYQATALPINYTSGPYAIDPLQSLYFRFSQINPSATGDVTVQIEVQDGDNPADPYTAQFTFPAPAPGTTWSNEVPAPQLISPTSGRTLDAQSLTNVTITQISGPAINCERLDYRQTHWIFLNDKGNPALGVDLGLGAFDKNFANPYLAIPKGYDLVVKGTNSSPSKGTRDIIVRVDDDQSSNYSTRCDNEIIVGAGDFTITLQLDGLRSNNRARAMDIGNLAKINVSVGKITPGESADTIISLIRIQPGFSFKSGMGWHFGDPNYSEPPSFTQVSPGDPSVTLYPGATSIGTRTTEQEKDSLVQSVMENVGTFTATGIPAGDYHLRLYAGWEGQYEVGPRDFLSRTISAVANGTTTVIEAVDYTANIKSWRQIEYLKRRTFEADLAGTVTPWDLYGRLHGDPLDGEVTIGSDGKLEIQITNASNSFATDLCAVILEPVATYNTPLSNIKELDTYRSGLFNGVWTIVPTVTAWPTIAAGALEVVEVPMQQENREPDFFIANQTASTPTVQETAPGLVAYTAFMVLSGSDGTPAIVHTPPTANGAALPTKLRFGQWIYTSTTGIQASPRFLRGDFDQLTLKANLPRLVAIEILVPYNAAAGVYTGSLAVTVNGTTITKSYQLEVLAKTLPAMNKPAGFYLFNTTPEWYNRLLNPVEWAMYESSLTRDLEVLAEHGANSMALGYAGELYPTDNASGITPTAPYALQSDIFLQHMKRYKDTGYGAQPWHLYGIFKTYCNESGLNAINGNNIVKVAEWTAPAATHGPYSLKTGHDAYRAALGLSASSHLVSMYFTPQGVTPAADGSTRTALAVDAGSVLLYVNGNNVAYANYTYDGADTINFAAGLTINQGDTIELRAGFGDAVNGYTLLGTGSNYVRYSEQLDWFYKGMSLEFDTACTAFKYGLDIALADQTTYPGLPYISVSDEVDPAADANGNYIPDPLSDWVIQAAAGIHRNIPYAKVTGNFGDPVALVAFKGCLDMYILNDGVGVSTATVQTVQSWGAKCMIYNTFNFRTSLGFGMWKMGYDGWINFASNSNSGDPFDPTDAEEPDVIQGSYPQPITMPAVPDIDACVADLAQGVVDYRWCLWLDEQVANNVSGALAVKNAILAQVPGTLAQAQSVTTAQMMGWRKQITDFAKTLGADAPPAVPPAAPVLANGNATTFAGNAVTFDLTTLVTGSADIIAMVDQPSEGTAVPNGTSVVYTPAANATGTDSFTCRVFGPNGGSNVATMSVTIQSGKPPAGDLHARQVADGALHIYNLDETSGGTANDTGSSPANGTLDTSVTPGQPSLGGLVAHSVLLTGENNGQGVTLPFAEIPNDTAGFCYEFLIQPTAIQKGHLAGNGAPSEGVGQYGFEITTDDDGTLRFSMNSASTAYQAVGPALVAGTVYHIVAGFDGSHVTLYVNGTQVANVPFTGTYADSYRNIGFGYWGGIDYTTYPCALQSIAIYPTALTQAQVTAHWNLV